MQGTILVDSDRNKAMIHATLDMSPIESAEMNMLIDFGEAYTITTIPMLNTCQFDALSKTYNLTDVFASLQTSSSYLGPQVVPWDIHDSKPKFRF